MCVYTYMYVYIYIYIFMYYTLNKHSYNIRFVHLAQQHPGTERRRSTRISRLARPRSR